MNAEKNKAPVRNKRSPIHASGLLVALVFHAKTIAETKINSPPKTCLVLGNKRAKTSIKRILIIGKIPFINTPPCAAGALRNPEKTKRM